MKKINKNKIGVAERLENTLVRIGRMRKVRLAKLISRAFVIALLIALGLTAGTIINSQAAMLADESRFPAYVEVQIDGRTVSLISYKNTIIEAIDEAGIKVGENDLLSLPDDQQLLPGQSYQLSISRLSNVKLSWSGYSISTATEEMSLRDLMSRSGFSELDGGSDSVTASTAQDQEGLDGAEITYTNIEVSEYREYEVIPYTTVEVDDPNMYIGESKVTTAGKDGRRVTVFEDTFEDGIFVSRVRIGSEIAENPVQQVIANGTKKKPVIAPIGSRANSTVVNSFNSIKGLLSRNGDKTYSSFTDNGDGTITIDGHTFNYLDKQNRTITMYDGLEVCRQSGCHSPAINHNTFSGVPAQRGIAATFGYRENGRYVGSNLPMGTIIFVERYGLAVIGDIHGVSSNPGLIDVSFDPGEIQNGTANIGRVSRSVYIISKP